MSDVFRPISPSERRAFRARYLEELRRRDGIPDIHNKTLSEREPFFRDLETRRVRRTGPPVMDQARFSAHETQHRPDEGLKPAELWALAVAKANRSERFGVEYSLARKGEAAYPPDDPMTYVEIEEFYHTRVLRDVVETIGLTMRMIPPRSFTRWMIQSMSRLPKSISNILVFCGELAGVAVFRLLGQKARELFQDQPEPLQRIESLFQQILTDEIGHVHFVHSKLGRVRLAIARMLLPLVVRSLASDLPELDRLFGHRALMQEIWRADLRPAEALPAPVPA